MAQQKILLENHMLATLFIMIFVFSLMFCLMMQLYSLVCLSVRDAQVTICWWNTLRDFSWCPFVAQRSTDTIHFPLSCKQNILYSVLESTLTLRDALTITRINVQHLQQELNLYNILAEQVWIHISLIIICTTSLWVYYHRNFERFGNYWNAFKKFIGK